MNNSGRQRRIAGFWPRIGALLIDSIILSIAGTALGLALGGLFANYPALGRCIGFMVGLAYFGYMNSRLGNGQTIGKKALRIRVVDSNDETISVARSLARFSLLGFPFTVFEKTIDPTLPWAWVVLTATTGLSFASIYLYVFNSATRQTLHDLAVGTYVVNTEADAARIDTIARTHLYVVVGLFAAAAMLASVILKAQRGPDAVAANFAVRALRQDPAVSSVAVSNGASKEIRDGVSTAVKYVEAVVGIRKRQYDNEEFARSKAAELVREYPPTTAADEIRVRLLYGYDIGIAGDWHTSRYRFTLAELAEN